MNNKLLGTLLILSISIPFSIGFISAILNYNYYNNLFVSGVVKLSGLPIVVFSIWSGVVLIRLDRKKDKNKEDEITIEK